MLSARFIGRHGNGNDVVIQGGGGGNICVILGKISGEISIFSGAKLFNRSCPL